MISTAKKPGKLTGPQARVTQRINDLREELEDLADYLDLLEARVRNGGKKVYTLAEVKKRLNLK